MSNILVYILYYDTHSEQVARSQFQQCSWARLLKVGPHIYNESQMFLNLLDGLRHEWGSKQYVGCLSWKCRAKTYIPDNIDDLLQHAFASGYELVPLWPWRGHDLFVQANIHPHFSSLWKEWFTSMGYDGYKVVHRNIPVFLGNYWVATPSTMDHFIKFTQDAVAALECLIECSPSFKERIYSHAQHGNAPLGIAQITGKDYYTHHPFLLERLVCFYVWIHKVRFAP